MIFGRPNGYFRLNKYVLRPAVRAVLWRHSPDFLLCCYLSVCLFVYSFVCFCLVSKYALIMGFTEVSELKKNKKDKNRVPTVNVVRVI